MYVHIYFIILLIIIFYNFCNSYMFLLLIPVFKNIINVYLFLLILNYNLRCVLPITIQQ